MAPLTPRTDRPAPQEDAPPALPLTGERTGPGVADERYWYERHVVAYQLAAAEVARLAAGRSAGDTPGERTTTGEHTADERTTGERTTADEQGSGPRTGERGTVPGPTVVDAGCGEGYGLAFLAEAGAGRVVGADYDAATVAHAIARYAALDPRIDVVHAELLAVPLPDHLADLTVSFQVIEHVYDVPGYLASLRRVTLPGGQLWVATPNRLTFTPDNGTPTNPYHVREFTAAELTAELRAADLEVVEVAGVHHGARLRAAEREHGPRLAERLAGDPEAWPPALRELVHRVEASWFEVRADELDASLDLIARCRVPAPDGP